jgi:hypothetical protein
MLTAEAWARGIDPSAVVAAAIKSVPAPSWQ